MFINTSYTLFECVTYSTVTKLIKENEWMNYWNYTCKLYFSNGQF